jgi:hypothetical protein
VTVTGGYTYVAQGNGGMIVLRFSGQDQTASKLYLPIIWR